MAHDVADDNQTAVEYVREDIFSPNFVQSSEQQRQERDGEAPAQAAGGAAAADGAGGEEAEATWTSVPIEGAIYQPPPVAQPNLPPPPPPAPVRLSAGAPSAYGDGAPQRGTGRPGRSAPGAARGPGRSQRGGSHSQAAAPQAPTDPDLAEALGLGAHGAAPMADDPLADYLHSPMGYDEEPMGADPYGDFDGEPHDALPPQAQPRHARAPHARPPHDHSPHHAQPDMDPFAPERGFDDGLGDSFSDAAHAYPSMDALPGAPQEFNLPSTFEPQAPELGVDLRGRGRRVADPLLDTLLANQAQADRGTPQVSAVASPGVGPAGLRPNLLGLGSAPTSAIGSGKAAGLLGSTPAVLGFKKKRKRVK